MQVGTASISSYAPPPDFQLPPDQPDTGPQAPTPASDVAGAAAASGGALRQLMGFGGTPLPPDGALSTRPPAGKLGGNTSVTGTLTPQQAQQLQGQITDLSKLGSGVPPARFQFLANFDGTNNDRNHVSLSGSPYQTNIANLADQAELAAKTNKNLGTGYYPGVGTGGSNGSAFSAGLNPTPPMQRAAEKAYGQFVDQANRYLQTNKDATYRDISASVAGFSRGAATGVMFAQMVDHKGLVLPDGTQIAPPHSIPINGMVLFDPVATGVQGDLSLPPNVQGNVLVVTGRDEHRSEFRLADYSQDPRAHIETIPGNHCGVGGGYDLNGTAAAARQMATAYLQNSGLGIAPVPANQRFDPSQPVLRYTENYRLHYAANGDVVGPPSAPVNMGNVPTHPDRAWTVDPGERRTVLIPAPHP